MVTPPLKSMDRLYKKIILSVVVIFATVTLFGCAIVDITPDQGAGDSTGGSGGRINGLAAAKDGQTMYAASEWGGLFKSSDAGLEWSHIPSHVPVATWDIEVDPSNPNKVYATSFHDGKVQSLSGISVSNDAGGSWENPTTSRPPEDFCKTSAGFAGEWRNDQFGAMGISINPDNTQEVYIGTFCGLAISKNAGLTWEFVDPFISLVPPVFDFLAPIPHNATTIWDVVVHDGGIVDVCGDDGHFRRLPNSEGWITATSIAQTLPGGKCSIAVSPHEPDVLFVVVGTTIYESYDGGKTWPNELVNPDPQGRVPFIETNDRGGASYDLWFGDISLWSKTCTTPGFWDLVNNTSATTTSRCGADWIDKKGSAHADVGTILFDSTKSSNACPVLFSNDGGVFYNTLTTSPDCHTPTWQQPNITPHAYWLFSMSGFNRAGDGEDLYFANQDTGVFASTDSGAIKPSWSNPVGADAFDIIGDEEKVVFTSGLFIDKDSDPPTTNYGWRINIHNVGAEQVASYLSVDKWGQLKTSNYPHPNSSQLVSFKYTDSIVQFGANDYALLDTGTHVHITFDLTKDPVLWSELGASTVPPDGCGLKYSQKLGEPQLGMIVFPVIPSFYLQTGKCMARSWDRIYRYDGFDSDGTWKEIHPPGDGPATSKGYIKAKAGYGKFSLYDVDPNDTDRIIASHFHMKDGAPKVRMVLSEDGGETWKLLPSLDKMMTGNGAFKFLVPKGGPTRFTLFWGYLQPTLLAFDPYDEDIILAGGADSGIFISTDSGDTWKIVTDPFTPSEETPHVPRPRFAHFDHNPDNLSSDAINLYIGTQGRGVWRLSALPDFLANVSGPKTASPGQDISKELKLDIQNEGAVDAKEVRVDIVLSTDLEVPYGGKSSRNFREDVLLAQFQPPGRTPLKAGKMQRYSSGIRRAIIPADTPPGKYYVCAQIDPSNTVSEYNEDDNVTCHPIDIVSSKSNKAPPSRGAR